MTASGVEVKVISAMADGSMIRVFVQARDLEGDRLSADMDMMGVVMRKKNSSVTGRANCVSYDAASKTALLEIDSWGQYTGQSEAELVLLKLGDVDPETDWRIPLTVETVDSRAIPLTDRISTAQLLELDVSPLGFAIQLDAQGGTLYQYGAAAYLEDGTALVLGKSWAGGSTAETRTHYWVFDDPVDIEDVVGVSVGYWYIPLDGDTAGPGYWLSELPE